MTTPEDRETARKLLAMLGEPNASDLENVAKFIAVYRAAERAKGFAACREAAAQCATAFPSGNDCECLGGADPETGVSECSLEARGGSCLCAERSEEADRIQAKIWALKEPS